MTLHTALQTAVEWDLLAMNPADAVKPPRFNPKDMRALDEDGLDKFLEAACQSPSYTLFFQAPYTGMKSSELLALGGPRLTLIWQSYRLAPAFAGSGMGPSTLAHLSPPKAAGCCP